MATWVRFIDSQKWSHLINLDTVRHFVKPPTKDERIDIYLNGDTSLIIHQKIDPVAYNKILEYMAQIEQQIK